MYGAKIKKNYCI